MAGSAYTVLEDTDWNVPQRELFTIKSSLQFLIQNSRWNF
jgi:hypothetical protein